MEEPVSSSPCFWLQAEKFDSPKPDYLVSLLLEETNKPQMQPAYTPEDELTARSAPSPSVLSPFNLGPSEHERQQFQLRQLQLERRLHLCHPHSSSSSSNSSSNSSFSPLANSLNSATVLSTLQSPTEIAHADLETDEASSSLFFPFEDDSS